ncbi:hypothetical protein NFI96_020518, partial [Prochilodus magdalenae]
NSFNAAPPAAGKHWVRLRYVGPGEAPNRNEVGAQLLQSQWINAADIHSFINLPNKKHYEIIFLQERALQSFSQIFQAGSSEGFWKFWEINTSTPQDECFIYVKFWTGRIANADVEQYIRRFCDILQPVHKLLDQFGLWYGVRRYKVKFRKNAEGGFLQIPNSISMGPYNGRISYQGQVQRCYVCHSTDHQVKDCNVIKCWKCGELGHKGKECVNTEKCNLCGVQGHSFFTCPNSYSNRARAQKQPRAEQQQVTDQVRERPVAENNIEAEPVLATKKQQQQLTSHQSAEGEEPAIESNSVSTGAVHNADPSEGESEAAQHKHLNPPESKALVKRLHYEHLSENTRDIMWLVSVGRLAVRAVVKWSCFGTTKECPFTNCHADETVEHLLVECQRAKDTWSLLKDIGYDIELLPAHPKEDVGDGSEDDNFSVRWGSGRRT